MNKHFNKPQRNAEKAYNRKQDKLKLARSSSEKSSNLFSDRSPQQMEKLKRAGDQFEKQLRLIFPWLDTSPIDGSKLPKQLTKTQILTMAFIEFWYKGSSTLETLRPQIVNNIRPLESTPPEYNKNDVSESTNTETPSNETSTAIKSPTTDTSLSREQPSNQFVLLEKPIVEPLTLEEKNSIDQLIDNLPVEVLDIQDSDIAKDQIKLVRDTLKKIAQESPETTKEVLSSKNFKVILKRGEYREAGKYVYDSNAIIMTVGFPTECRPLFDSWLHNTLAHEMRHALLNIVASNGNPTAFQPKHLITKENIDDVTLEKQDITRTVFDFQKNNWFLVTRDFDNKIIKINLSKLSQNDLPQQQNELDLSSIASIDLKALYETVKGKTVENVSLQDIRQTRGRVEYVPPFVNNKKQLLEFNKRTLRAFKDISKKKLSSEQKKAIESYYKPAPIMTRLLQNEQQQYKKDLDNARKEKRFLATDSEIVVDHYVDVYGNLGVLAFPGNSANPDKNIYFQEWVKYRTEQILKYKKPNLIATEIFAFLGELGPSLAKALFPEPWDIVNTPVEQHLKSSKNSPTIYSSKNTSTIFQTEKQTPKKPEEKLLNTESDKEKTISTNPNSFHHKKHIEKTDSIDIQGLINTVPIIVNAVDSTQKKYQIDYVRTVLEKLAGIDPVRLKIVLNSKNFNIQLLNRANSEQGGAYSDKTNTLSIDHGFPSAQENNSLVFSALLNLIHHELRHAVLAIIRTNGDPISFARRNFSCCSGSDIEKNMLGNLVFTPRQNIWSILTRDLNDKPLVIKLHYHSEDEMKNEQKKLNRDSALSTDLSKLSVSMRDKTPTSLRLYPEILKQLESSSPYFPFEVKKNSTIQEQIDDFNKKADESFKHIQDNLSPKQKQTIKKHYKPIPTISRVLQDTSLETLKQSLIRARKEGRVFTLPKIFPNSPVVDFYFDNYNNLYLLLLPSDKEGEVVAFQQWVKGRQQHILAYEKPLDIAKEINSFLGEMPPELAKEFFPDLWKIVNEPIEKHEQSMSKEIPVGFKTRVI